MRYTFEVICHDDENIIKLDISYGSNLSSIQRTVSEKIGKCEYQKQIHELVTDIIDNLRLTVKEREEALYNANIFLKYLNNSYNEFNLLNKVPDKIILESINEQ